MALQYGYGISFMPRSNIVVFSAASHFVGSAWNQSVQNFFLNRLLRIEGGSRPAYS
jgi:hypothetical protein